MVHALEEQIRHHDQQPAPATVQCAHCGLVVPKGLVDRSSDEQFCCRGCRTAWELIHDCGLESFYHMIDADDGNASLRDRSSESLRFAEFDEPDFLSKFVSSVDSTPGNKRSQVVLGLDGIHCAACVWLIEKLPNMTMGVVSAEVNWARATVSVCWQTERTKLSTIASALHRLGYTPHCLRIDERQCRRAADNRRQLTQIGIAAAAAGNNMLIAIALYLGMFTAMSLDLHHLFRAASCLVGLVAFLGPGRVFLRGAINALRTRTPHMDLPIAVGLTAGTIAGTANTISGTGEIYFDSLSVLIFLLLVGRWIQFRQQNQAADAVDLLYRLTPSRARRIEGEKIVEITADALQIDDVLEIRPGDLVAADGEIIRGQSHVDESILTGESHPISKSVGNQVAAGTQNLTEILNVRVRATGTATRIGQIMELVENAAASKPQIVQWANQIGGHFVVVTLFLAALTWLIWAVLAPEHALDRAVAVLVIACPCALAMATPLAISVALGRMAQSSILVKHGDVMQCLSKPGIIWLDKTGTLTDGEIRVATWTGNSAWLAVVAAVESGFSHPIANAFSQFLVPNKPIEIEYASQWEGGVVADCNGQRILIGNRQLLREHQVDVDPTALRDEQNILASHLSPCWVAVDDKVVGLAGLGDTLREDASFAIAQWRQMGWEIGMLSGDHEEIVRQAARQLGIKHVYGGVTPQGKLKVVRQSLRQFETTVMVGDGVNDSAALAAATVGIAVHNGAEASLAAAPVYLSRADLGSITELLQSSRSTTNIIRRNLAVSLTYNICGIALAMYGWLNPLVAAVLMPLSSFSVIALSLSAGNRGDTPNRSAACANPPARDSFAHPTAPFPTPVHYDPRSAQILR